VELYITLCLEGDVLTNSFMKSFSNCACPPSSRGSIEEYYSQSVLVMESRLRMNMFLYARNLEALLCFARVITFSAVFPLAIDDLM